MLPQINNSLPYLSSFQVPKSYVVRYGYLDSLNGMHQGIIEALKERARDIILEKHERWLESMEVKNIGIGNHWSHKWKGHLV